MPKTPPERGASRERILVPGINQFPQWHGIQREGTPSSIPDNRFWLAQNVRLRGGSMVGRGGQTKVNTLPTDGCIEGIWPVDPGPDPDVWTGPEYMWLLNDGGVGSPATMRSYDGVTVESLTQPRNGRARYMFADADGLFVTAGGSSTGQGVASELRQIFPDGAGDITQEVLVALVGEGPPNNEQSLITTMTRFNDLLVFFVATTTIGHQGGLYTWDGATATREVVVSGSGSLTPAMAVVDDELLVASQNFIRRRDLAGTWDTVSLPVGTLTVTKPYSGAAYNGAAYFVGTGASGFAIFRYLSGSVTVVHSIAGANTETGLGGFSTFGDDLYLAYRIGGVPTIAKFDGAAWTDAVSTFPDGFLVAGLKEDTATGRLYALREASFDYTTNGVDWTQVAAIGAEHLAFY